MIWVLYVIIGILVYWIALGFILTALRPRGRQGVYAFLGSLWGNGVVAIICSARINGLEDLEQASLPWQIFILVSFPVFIGVLSFPFSGIAAFVGYQVAMVCGYTDSKRILRKRTI
jgi:hypothetical protein